MADTKECSGIDNTPSWDSDLYEDPEVKFWETIDRLDQNDPTLTKVDLEGLEIGDEGVVELVDTILSSETDVKFVNLASNNFGIVGVTALCRLLMDGRIRCQTPGENVFLDLVLAHNKLDDEAAIAIAEALQNKTNRTMVRLYLRNNKIGLEGVKVLAKVLTATRALGGVFDLAGNNMGDEGACVIAEALRGNNDIKRLHLDGNKIGDAGTIAIANAIVDNRTLTCLDLDHNDIGLEGILALAEVLKQERNNNETKNVSALVALDLCGNCIGSEGVIALGSALRYNSTLVRLKLWTWDTPQDDVSEMFRNVLEFNDTLLYLWIQEMRSDRMLYWKDYNPGWTRCDPNLPSDRIPLKKVYRWLLVVWSEE